MNGSITIYSGKYDFKEKFHMLFLILIGINESAISWELQRRRKEPEIYVGKFVWGTQYTYHRYKIYIFVVLLKKKSSRGNLGHYLSMGTLFKY